MFGILSNKISSIFNKYGAVKKQNTASIEEFCEEIKGALVDSDVPYDLAKEFIVLLKKAIQEAGSDCSTSDALLKVVSEALINFLGGRSVVPFSFQLPAVILVVGLQGSGKTTTIAKLVHFAQKQAEKRGKKRKILVASVDFNRPAAIDQLEIITADLGISFYRASSQDVAVAVKEVYAYYKAHEFELLFLDTAGRLHIDESMLNELVVIKNIVQPRYRFLVLDAMTGQQSLAVARGFEAAVGFDAAILSKMDSDARGGCAFAFRCALKKPILFVGMGEKRDDLEQFYPERVASKILGMGDLQTLFEKATEKMTIDSGDTLKNMEKLSLQDFADQLAMIKNLGSLSVVARYMPSVVGNLSSDDLERGDHEIKKFRAIINAMTPGERKNYKIIGESRRKRIALGAGVSVDDVKNLLERFQEVQNYVNLLRKAGPFKRFFR